MYLIVFDIYCHHVYILNILVSCHVEENALTLPKTDGCDSFHENSSDNDSESNINNHLEWLHNAYCNTRNSQ